MLTLATAATAIPACVAPGADSGVREVPLLALASTPGLEIGTVDGDPRYVFEDIVSVLPVAGGGIAVSDAGSSEITLYDPDGAFVSRWGGRGEGPGEFTALSRLHPWTADSILALDALSGRVTIFDATGTFGRVADPIQLSRDSTFSMDAWLYGRYWVEGPLTAADRNAAKTLLDRLPPPISAPGYRFARMTSDGGFWIREPGLSAEGNRRWIALDENGGIHALIDVPVHFEPLTIESDRVWGRWLGENDIHFARSYALRDTGARSPMPAWLTEPQSLRTVADEGEDGGEALPGGRSPDEEALMSAIKTGLRSTVIAQEMHYASHGSYTPFFDSLELRERPEGVVVDIVHGGSRGWAAVFTHPEVDRICGLAYGNPMPPGWMPGAMNCGPSAMTPTPEAGN